MDDHLDARLLKLEFVQSQYSLEPRSKSDSLELPIFRTSHGHFPREFTVLSGVQN